MTKFRKELLADIARSFGTAISVYCKTNEEVNFVVKIISTYRTDDPYANVDMTPDAEGRTTGDVNDR